MVRIAIVEDREDAAETLSAYLEQYREATGDEFHVTCFRDAVQFLEPYLGFDLVFMDIQMPHMDGLEGAARLRRIDRRAKLIFVTNMAQYAVRGYEVEALDFIVKPVAYPDFSFKMKRAMNAVRMSRRKELSISLPTGLMRISSDELLYVEVRGHVLSYHLLAQTVAARGTMDSLEQQLATWDFLRCNNCYLVNPRYIDWVRGYVIKVGDDELQISHPRKKQFMQQLGEWFTKGGA